MRKRHARLALGLFAVAALALPGSGDAAVSGPVIASYGNWDVHRTIEAVTGKRLCIATYRGNARLELNIDILILQSSDTRNPQGFRYRIDEQPISPFITASNLVRRTRTIGFGGDSFKRLLSARRLRVEVLGRHDVREFDIDLSGIYSAWSAIYYCH